ncbi:MAG: Triosephosphate isomerase [Candidatus Jorgensenbacteria bacterium GW2011_GWA2_45_13]|uniref:Triosephosphate isomerase n=1 Tax=Candidatus Jorgensenbacteria bacterium GW2011_GWA2_45_13 TaxID=1618662 RepID=A0A0G1L9F1_9BACT|nr:MAG: Triosephosphate isomerase [Candidatus Jorgensenbacteria bacterium GW2011_GWA2_45_13]
MSRRAGLRFVDKILFHFLRIEFYTNWEENEFMSKLLFANWKMNPVSEKEAIILARVGDVKHAVILPPFLFLPTVGKILKNAKFGVQNISWEKEGALTGEVSAEMVKKMGANYAIIGHSERREFLGESDEVIAAKVRTSLDAGLTPILCVGEPKSVH